MPSADSIRTAAVALAEYACGYEKGRSKDDPVYKEVTENRDGPTPAIRKTYSSCGDLGHWLLYRLGCRQPWVNRNAPPLKWRTQLNLSLLVRGEVKHPEAGDILVIANQWPSGRDGHVCVWLGDGRVANYGAGGMSPAASPGARISSPPLIELKNGFQLGARIVRSVLSIPNVPYTEKPNLEGALLDGMTIDDMLGTLVTGSV